VEQAFRRPAVQPIETRLQPLRYFFRKYSIMKNGLATRGAARENRIGPIRKINPKLAISAV
jgi:hypothetical protein